MSSTSAMFVGDGSLLLQCASAWREAGHSVVAIASHSDDLARWAALEGIAFVALDPDAQVSLPDAAFDYLFSVANLQLLPADLLARARTLAVNFHDGPLPRYAGVNATSWALMAGESTHGITWHEMTERADAGRIVKQVLFPVRTDETAFSLNARCYEAGLAAFTEIARDAANGPLQMKEQQGARTWFGRDRRPGLLGTIDFTQPAESVVALVRSLDFGTYANPLALAKLWLPQGLATVRHATISTARSGLPPGTVVGSGGDSLTVACAEGDVVLSGLSPLSFSAPAWPDAGTCLPIADAALRAAFESRTPVTAQGERHWRRAFASLSPVALPYPRSRGDQAGAQVPLGVTSQGERTIAAFAAWLAALTSQARVSMLYSDTGLQDAAARLDPWLNEWVPLTIDCASDMSSGAVMDATRAAMANARVAGPCTRDLPLRIGDKRASVEALARVAACLSPSAPPAGCELLLTCDDRGELVLRSGPQFDAAVVEAMARPLREWLVGFQAGDVPLSSLRLQGAHDSLQGPVVELDAGATMHGLFAAQAARTPDAVALEWHDVQLTYRALDERSTSLAHSLVARGVQAGDIVGLRMPRTPELVIALLGVLKAGAAYLPLDPDYPADRIDFMVRDSGTKLVLSRGDIQAFCAAGGELDANDPGLRGGDKPGDPQAAAYVIYTSGSTGQPKGVVVTHRNVVNFFAGMDPRIAHEPPGRWLAVTSLSFDISVLELCWTLARGFTVVLHSNVAPDTSHAPGFSLFYFASDHASTAQDRYRLLMEGAKFADRHGFEAVWTPERHFHAFGGLYPNPAVTSAALAAATTRIGIRAGSCVLPLHHPIRVAEEWAFVDNISQGRVGISFASGWQPNDFVIAPGAFADRKASMLRHIDTVKRLWRGETLPFPGPDGKDVPVSTLPRPVQKELPVWVTAAGNPETFRQAGELGCHLLTHLLGQDVKEVAEKLRVYRMAWAQAGHPGRGHVTLMLHTFVGDDDDAVRETVREPMKAYLRSSVDLIRQAAWSFPAFVQRASEGGRSPVDVMEAAPLSDAEMDALLDHAFNRYYGTSALFGTPERCLAMVRQLQGAGVDEIACLVDFGVATDTVLAHLEHLKQLMEDARGMQPQSPRASVAEDIVRHRVTHLQCTPSMAAMLVADTAGRTALSQLQALMVGGEALQLPLARELRALVPGQLLNMYGPTETTIWSTTCDLATVGEFVPLGTAIANTTLRIANAWGMACPDHVPGELWIGGAGVARGYHLRDGLTTERFVTVRGERFYRTGDLVRRHPDGRLEFLGRIDHQVKIRGHRIELGEIESALLAQPGVKDAVVVARGDGAGEKRLLGYVTAHPGAKLDADLLRAALAERLPEVMVPAKVMALAALPLTPNGKVDRRALPDPQAVAVRPVASAPRNEFEQAIAAIWQDVLGLPEVGLHDNFFDLGGHSLLVVQVQRRLREAIGREVSITDMFRLPTIAALAALLGGDAPAQTAVDAGLARAQARRMMRSRANGAAASHA